MAFVDLDKVYDCVPRDLIWLELRKKNIPEAYKICIRQPRQEYRHAVN